MSKIIGLTGQSGAGKTTISNFFATVNTNDFKVINCDIVAKQATEKNSIGLSLLTDFFGKDILNKDGNLNRQYLANICFNNKEALAKLNSILHPIILQSIKDKINSFDNISYIILDAPTLFESGADKLCDVIISVIADENVRFERILKRDKISKERINDRFKNQLSQEFFINNSDFIIKNNKDNEFENQIWSIIDEIKK